MLKEKSCCNSDVINVAHSGRKVTTMNKRNGMVKTLVTVGLQLVIIGSVLSINPVLVAAQESDKIANAMSAGPAAITAEATILDYPGDPSGDMIVLREGTNGWTCFTDWPATPGNDPMCVDQVWLEFLDALVLGEEPNVTAPGLAYMLQGGSEASNTDPFAMEPAPGDDWMTTPPHVMLLYPDSVDLSQFTTDHTSGEPYVMWAGTPYEHIMMPVEDTASDVEKAIANAMSAGPAAITAHATILDWPSDPAGDMIVLREGTNGWTCYTDWPATPGNDPMCLDQVWVEWNNALALGEKPNVTRPGVAYMLAGGSSASNTDPFAMEPAPGEDWMSSPPHVMFLYPDSVDLSQFTTDPTSGEPYVMWAGTPYEHIMMPVALGR